MHFFARKNAERAMAPIHVKTNCFSIINTIPQKLIFAQKNRKFYTKNVN